MNLQIYGKILNFHQWIYARARHDVLYVKAAVHIMLADTSVWGNDSGDEAHRGEIDQIDRVPLRTQKFFKYGIITGKHGKNLPFEWSAGFPGAVMIPHAAFLTTELLVCPSIRNPIATLQTFRHSPDILPVTHIKKPFVLRYKVEIRKNALQGPADGFSFSERMFFSFWKASQCTEKSMHISKRSMHISKSLKAPQKRWRPFRKRKTLRQKSPPSGSYEEFLPYFATNLPSAHKMWGRLIYKH